MGIYSSLQVYQGKTPDRKKSYFGCWLGGGVWKKTEVPADPVRGICLRCQTTLLRFCSLEKLTAPWIISEFRADRLHGEPCVLLPYCLQLGGITPNGRGRESHPLAQALAYRIGFLVSLGQINCCLEERFKVTCWGWAGLQHISCCHLLSVGFI